MPMWFILLADTLGSALAGMAILIAIFYNEYVDRATDNANLLDEIGVMEKEKRNHDELEHYDEFGLSVGSAKAWKATALETQRLLAEEKRTNVEQWEVAFRLYPSLPNDLYTELTDYDGGAGS